MQELLYDGEAHHRINDAARAVGLAPRLLRALIHLSPRREVPMRDLAARFECDGSYVTMLINELEDRGMARRKTDARDRRVKSVTLTDFGVSVLSRAQKLLWEPPRAFGALSDEEQRQLRDLLKKLAAADHLLAAGIRVARAGR